MSDLKILLKNNFNILLGNLQGKKTRKANSAVIPIILLALVGIVAVYSLQSWSMFHGLSQLNLQKVALFHGVSQTVLVLLILGVTRITEAKSNDADFLLSLPLRKSSIIIAKTMGKYLFDLALTAILILPYVVMYTIFTSFNIVILLSSIMVVVLLPLFSVGISYFCDFLVVRLFNRTRAEKMLKSMFAVVIIVAVVVLLIFKSFSYGTVSYETLDAFFSDRPVTNLILQTITNISIGNVAILLAITIIPFVLGLIMYSFNFGKTFSKFSTKTTKLHYGQNGGLFSSLLKKEVNNYFTTPAYISNTIIGAVMMIILSIAVAVMGIDGIAGLFGIAMGGEELVAYLAMILAFCLATCYISACSISLEGKQLWIIKSTPISEKTLFMAKISTHLIVLEPFVLISSLTIGIALQISFVNILLVFVYSTIANIMLAVGGLFINLCLPKMEWSDVASVVKQSSATLIAMLYGSLLTVLPLIINLIFGTAMIFCLAISVFVYILLVIIFTALLFTKGIKMFRKI